MKTCRRQVTGGIKHFFSVLSIEHVLATCFRHMRPPPSALLKNGPNSSLPEEERKFNRHVLVSRNQEGAKRWLGFRFGFGTSPRIGADRAHSLVDARECYGEGSSFSELARDLYRAAEYLGEGLHDMQP